MGPVAQYCRMPSRCLRDILAKDCMGGQVGMSIFGPPTTAVPGPVRSRKNSLHNRALSSSCAGEKHLPAFNSTCEDTIVSMSPL